MDKSAGKKISPFEFGHYRFHVRAGGHNNSIKPLALPSVEIYSPSASTLTIPRYRADGSGKAKMGSKIEMARIGFQILLYLFGVTINWSTF
jgi:hypothetical protein